VPKRMVTSPVFWSAIVLGLFYFLLAKFVPIGLLIQVLNSLFIGMCVSVFMMNLRLGWNLLRVSSTTYDRADQFAISVDLLWIALFLARVSSSWDQIRGVPGYYIDTQITGLIIYIVIVAGAMQVTAPGLATRWERSPLLYWSAVVGAAVAVALFVAQSYGPQWIAPSL